VALMLRRVRIEEVLAFLGEDAAELLRELRGEGLFEQDLLEAEAAEELRVAAALMRELGVNAAGVEVALQLRRRLLVLERRMEGTLRRLLEDLEKA
jgi:hypothetical protein